MTPEMSRAGTTPSGISFGSSQPRAELFAQRRYEVDEGAEQHIDELQGHEHPDRDGEGRLADPGHLGGKQLLEAREVGDVGLVDAEEGADRERDQDEGDRNDDGEGQVEKQATRRP